jgi:hypothetical protein
MILEWRRRNPIENLKLQWRGPNLLSGDFAPVDGPIMDLEQVNEVIAVIAGPPGADAPPRIASLQFVIDGGGEPITAGEEIEIPDVPFNCEIIGWTLTADIAGSAEITISRATYAGYPTFSEISGTEKPTLVSAQKSQDTALSTWNTQLNLGDVLKAKVDSAQTIERLYIGLRVQEN